MSKAPRTIHLKPGQPLPRGYRLVAPGVAEYVQDERDKVAAEEDLDQRDALTELGIQTVHELAQRALTEAVGALELAKSKATPEDVDQVARAVVSVRETIVAVQKSLDTSTTDSRAKIVGVLSEAQAYAKEALATLAAKLELQLSSIRTNLGKYATRVDLAQLQDRVSGIAGIAEVDVQAGEHTILTIVLTNGTIFKRKIPRVSASGGSPSAGLREVFYQDVDPIVEMPSINFKRGFFPAHPDIPTMLVFRP